MDVRAGGGDGQLFSTPPYTYTCICCGFTESFASVEEAFEKGWDTPERFSTPPFCPLCPSSPFILKGLTACRKRHELIHAKWEFEGRPKEFDLVAELQLDREKLKTEEKDG